VGGKKILNLVLVFQSTAEV